MTAKLTLGPLLFHWPPERQRDFYYAIADEAPVDTVCLGEVVCAKRAPFVAPVLPEVGERLRAAGKEVVLSTLALVMGEREMSLVREIVDEGQGLVEANDVSGLALLAGRPHAIGPFLNVYNEGTLAFLEAKGARRVCLPPELSAAALAALARDADVELEVQVFGRLPLAISARCYHARSRGLHKDSCQYVCAEDADGLGVETLDGVPLFAVNGTQTLSHACGNLVHELGTLRELGLSRFRLSPHDTDMVAVARAFRDVLDGRSDAGAAFERLAELLPARSFANGFFHGTEGIALLAGEEGRI